MTVADHLVDVGVVGQVGGRAAEPLLEPRQVHAVVGLDADRDRSCALVHDSWIWLPSLFT